MNKYILACLTAKLLLATDILFGQHHVVSPGAFEHEEAPDAAVVSDFPSYRFQQVYSVEDFAHLGDGPFTITRVDWRPGSEMIDTIDYPSERFIMRFSTTDIDPSVDGPVFDPVFANNINGSVKQVFDGPITMTTANDGPVDGPKLFDYGLELQAPYFYDPSQGNLMMDLTVVNGETALLLDFINSPVESSTTRMHFAPSSEAESSAQELGGHVLQFTVEEARPSPFFWDEFNRTDLYETDIKYLAAQPEEEYEIVDGSLIVTSLGDNPTFPSVSAHVRDTSDFVIKTQVKLLDTESCEINPFLSVLGRDKIDGMGGGYWGGYSANGRVYVGEEPGSIRNQTQRYTCEEVQENDVHMEYRFVGDTMEFTSWLDGDEKPENPDLVMRDRTHQVNDVIGVFINPSDQLEAFAVRFLAYLPSLEADFDASGGLDSTDIDLLSDEVHLGKNNRAFDLNGDTVVDAQDRNVLVSELLNTYFGDANLDGEFNSSDFVEVFLAGQYEDDLVGNSTWATGDWNGDSEFDSGDFIIAFQDGGFEQGPKANLSSVPEPNSRFLAIMCVCVSATVIRKRSQNLVYSRTQKETR